MEKFHTIKTKLGFFVKLNLRCKLRKKGKYHATINGIIFAIKPQDLGAVLQDVIPSLEKKLAISICAGITTKMLERSLGKVPVLRVMPNMPAQISQGVSAIASGRYAKLKDKKLAVSSCACIGEVVEVKEKLMDAVTAISGSGPAYLFYCLEYWIKAAEQMGISRPIAEKLARKMVLGSAMLIDQSLKRKSLEQMLRKRVTSKGGTTEAAVNVFKKKALGNILQQACYAAAKRSKQLQK